MSTVIVTVVFAGILLASGVSSLPLEDEVLNLPDFGAPPSRMFSGFVPDGAAGQLHYVLAFPDTAALPINVSDGRKVDALRDVNIPVASLTTGGPGCSSALFFWTEAGPLLFRSFNTTAPAGTKGALYPNEYSWTKQPAFLVAISQPSGVGLSYNTQSAAALAVNDTVAADRFFFALQYLFERKFPELVRHRFFIIGESYAGIYMLLQAQRVMRFRGANPDSATFSNWQGLMVGNGVTDHRFDDAFVPSVGNYAVGHALINQRQFDDVLAACPAGEYPDSDKCGAFYSLFPFDVDGGLNIYDTTGFCYNPKTVRDSAPAASRHHLGSRLFLGNMKHRAGIADRATAQAAFDELTAADNAARTRDGFETIHGPLGRTTTRRASVGARRAGRTAASLDADNFFQCPRYLDLTCTDEYYIDQYMQRADVQQALHVPAAAVGKLHFSVCSDINYTKSTTSVVPIYADIMAFNRAQRSTGRPVVDVVIYNGDSDLAVPYTGTWGWMAASGWRQTTEFRRWTYVDRAAQPLWGQQLGGYVMQMAPTGGADGGGETLFFATVRGAGHMVPSSKPAAAYELVSRVLQRRLFNETTTAPLPGGPVMFRANAFGSSAAAAATAGGIDGGSVGIGIAIGVAIALLLAGVVFAVARGRQRRDVEGAAALGSTVGSGYVSHET